MSVYQRPNGLWAAQMYDRSLGRARQIGTFDSREAAEHAVTRRAEKASRTRRTRAAQRERMDHWVYRCFDAEGTLLYVGITWQAIARISEHRAQSEWTTTVARIDVEHYPTREEAAAREEELIQTEHPPHNRRGARPVLAEDEMSVEMVAELVGLSAAWVRKEITEGRLAGIARICGSRTVFVVPMEAYERWVEAC